MPRVLVRNNRVVTRNGRVLIDSPACKAACCGGTPPPDCCDGPGPHPCGKRWMICQSSYVYHTSIATTNTDRNGVTRSITRTVDESQVGGPFAYTAVGNCPTAVQGNVPVKHTETIVQTCPPGENCPSTSETGYFCTGVVYSCIQAAGNSFNEAATFSHLTSQAAGGFRWDRDWGLMFNNAVGTHPIPGGQETVTRAYYYAPGECTYESSLRGQFVLDPDSGGGRTVVTYEASTTIHYNYKVLESCEGQIFTPCDGSDPRDCDGVQPVIQGTPCGRVGPGRVFLPFANVQQCGVVQIAEAGGYCYRFDKSGPIFPSMPGGGILGNELVTGSAAKTCCVCGAARGVCTSARLPSGGCRQSARRDPITRELVIIPAFINDGGGCCCNGSDIITIGRMQSDVELGNNPQYGYRQRWELTRGGDPFRRDQVSPLGTGANSTLQSKVTDLDDLHEIPYDWTTSPTTNQPPMACEWTFLNYGLIDFSRPQFPDAGFWNSALQMNLPCPGDGDVVINGFVLINWQYSQTCDSFVFDATWAHINGGTVRNRMNISITKQETPGDPCTGGCSPPQPPPGTGVGVPTPPSLVDVLGGG